MYRVVAEVVCHPVVEAVHHQMVVARVVVIQEMALRSIPIPSIRRILLQHIARVPPPVRMLRYITILVSAEKKARKPLIMVL